MSTRVLLLSLAVVIAACGGNANPTNNSDQQKPTITIVEPAENTAITLGEQINVAGTASDNIAVTGVEVALADTNGDVVGPIAANLSGGNWTVVLTTNNIAVGDYKIIAKAKDAANNQTAVERAVTLNAPADGQITLLDVPAIISDLVTGNITFVNPNVTGLECSLTTAVAESVFVTCSNSFSYTNLLDGQYRFVVRGQAATGNVSVQHDFTIDTQQPIITATGPSGDVTQGLVTVNFSISDATALEVVCLLDGNPIADCSSPLSLTINTLGQHNITIEVTDAAGNKAEQSFNFVIVDNGGGSDTVPPVITLTNNPSNPTNQQNANFAFTVVDASSVTITCDLDGNGFVACPNGTATYSSLAFGGHTFTVRAVDASSNQTEQSFSWAILNLNPSIQITNISPSANPTNANQMTVSFTATDIVGSTSCSVNGGTPVVCTSPHVFSGLTTGNYVFTISANTQFAGVIDVDSATIIVDQIAPTATFLTTPNNPTNDTTPNFTFATLVPEVGVSFICNLDSNINLVPCNQNHQESSLTDGAHTLYVRAVDSLSNIGALASTSWTQDTTAPDVQIDTTPNNPTNSTSATFTFSSTEVGATFECKLDGGAFAACTSPKNYAGLTQAAHSFQVRASDALGNTSSAVSVNWTVVPTASLTIDSAPTETTSAASFSFSGVSLTGDFYCQLDNNTAEICTSPKNYNGLNEGGHSITVTAAVVYGGEASDTFNWTVDLTGPVATFSLAPSDPTNDTTPNFTFATLVPEVGVSFICNLDSNINLVPCNQNDQESSLTDGVHTLYVRAVDSLGNIGALSSYTWTQDTTPPTVQIDSAPASPTNSTSAAFSFSANDMAATFECKLDAGAFSACTSPKNYAGLTQTAHSFQVRASDALGNTSSAVSANWTVVPTASLTIDSAPTETTSAVSFSFSGVSINTIYCKLDSGTSAECTSPKSYTGLTAGNHSFTVTATTLYGGEVTDTHAFVADITGPTATFTNAPAAATNSTTANFTFSFSEAVTSAQCKFDTGSFSSCGTLASHSITNVTEVSHTLQVKGVDALGNVGAITETTWIVDTTAPGAVTIFTNPDPVTSSVTATFAFAVTNPGVGTTYRCALDSADNDDYTVCSSPHNYTNLTPGSHTFRVKAVDAATNVGAVTTFTWTVFLGQVTAGGGHSCVITTIAGQNKLYCWGNNTAGQVGIGSAAVDVLTATQVGSATDWIAISAGFAHTCGILNELGAKKLYCWGSDSDGQLGRNIGSGTVTSPVQIGGETDWQSIAAGDAHTCGIRDNGTLWCWGRDSVGQLGINGNGSDVVSPTQVGSATDWQSVATGSAHSCGIRNENGSHKLYCWGSNTNGQLGDNSTSTAITPVEASGNHTDWQTAAAGGAHSCATRNGNQLYCWGADFSGQLGIAGAGSNVLTPTQVGGDSDWQMVATGDAHTCGIRDEGGSLKLYCWGDDEFGPLAIAGLNTNHTSPMLVFSNVTNWLAVDLADMHTCGLRSNQTVECAGFNGSGRLGNGKRDFEDTVLTMSDTKDWTRLAAGGNGHTCGIEGGRLWCWGDDRASQLGLGSFSYGVTPPTQIGNLNTWTRIAAGTGHTCGIEGGRLWCWGNNSDGQLGLNDTTNRTTPTQVTAIANDQWTEIAAGDGHTCGVHNNQLYCWGRNDDGQVGNNASGVDVLQPVQLDAGSTVWVSVAAGSAHSCGLINPPGPTNERMYCWGRDVEGQIGDGNADAGADQLTPIQVNGFTWQSLTVGSNHTCGFRVQGGGVRRAYCWGSDASGQLGNDNAFTNQTAPAEASGAFTDWQVIRAGGNHTCGIRNANRLFCWGSDSRGQLGLPLTTADQPTPQQVGSETDWELNTLALGADFTVGTQSDGGAIQGYSFGDNTYGQLGLGYKGFSTVLLPVTLP